MTEYEIVAHSDKENIIVYANKMTDWYTDFKIDFNGVFLNRPFWINTTDLTWSPQIVYEDINRDGKEEIVIILTLGSGTGVLEQEAHVFQIENQQLGKFHVETPIEILVDNPVAIVLKNVKTELSPNKAVVTIGDKQTIVNIESLDIQTENLFKDVVFDNLIRFDVIEKKLVASLGAQISPVCGYLGDIQITYTLKDNMYQAKKIKFQLQSLR